MAEELAPKRCFKCKRELRGDRRTRAVFSPKSGKYYCPVSDTASCDRLRRAGVRAGTIDKEADGREVTAAVKRRGA